MLLQMDWECGGKGTSVPTCILTSKWYNVCNILNIEYMSVESIQRMMHLVDNIDYIDNKIT